MSAILGALWGAASDLPIWANYGVLGGLVIALVVTKQLVPGWIFNKTAQDNDELRQEVARLVERLLSLSENAVPALRESTKVVEQAIEEMRLVRSRSVGKRSTDR